MIKFQCFEEWRPELEGASHLIEVLTNHRNLFMTSKLLNRHPARWSKFLSCFNFNIIFCPGNAGAKLRALTQRSGDLPGTDNERMLKMQNAALKLQYLPTRL
jgi:hypothetical protein